MSHVFNRLTLVFTVLTALLIGLTTATANAAPGDNFRITNNATGGTLIPQDFGGNSSDDILMYAWHDYDTRGGEQWNLERTPSGYLLIRNVRTGKCLKPGGDFHFKTSVTQGSCNDTYEYHWLDKANVLGDTYKLLSRSTNKVLSPYYGREPGEVVVLESDSNIAKNWWSINRI
ncbi:hypothetical protein GCM10010232_01440 [Streptomyces amakusaensis]|uniref:RICIN domain-containing protein n=1 Tax=Streptomyces amakusaensis TaxID=67271 RepID=A0ABW0AT47_9ACTN